MTRRSAIFTIAALAFAAVLCLLLVLPRPKPPVPAGPTPFDTLHPHTQAEFRRLGIAPEQVTQGIGAFPASAGIHSADGTVYGRPYCAAFDVSVSDLTPAETRQLLGKLRGAGLACWWRVPGVSFPLTTMGGVEAEAHIHGVDPFVPHKPRLEAQIRDYIAGRNGLEVGRYAHRPDPPEADPQSPVQQRLLRQRGGVWRLR